MKTILVFIIILLPISLIGCAPSTPTPDKIPGWVNNLIAEYQREPVGNPPQSIWQYEYNDQTVYYVPPQCCDQYSKLYDAGGNIICAPDGGITGQGDGKCSDFFQTRKDGRVIWQDTRTR